MPLITQPYPIAAPGEAIDADARCQSRILGSATLAYACLLIRRGDMPLARHMLETLERKPAAFRDVLPYMRVWMEIESGNFEQAKTELLSLLGEQSGDLLALSLLQALMVLEAGGRGADAVVEKPPAAEGDPAAAPAPPDASFRDASAPDLSAYHGVLADPQAHAFGVWENGGFRFGGDEEFGGMLEAFGEAFPKALQDTVAALEGGAIHKATFCFENLTVAGWQTGENRTALIAGPLQQALLTLVRAENAFARQVKPAPVAGDGAG